MRSGRLKESRCSLYLNGPDQKIYLQYVNRHYITFGNLLEVKVCCLVISSGST